MKIKLIKILILTITVMIVCSNIQVFATQNPYLNDLDAYNPETETQSAGLLAIRVRDVVGIINFVGTICSVVILCIIGLKYMLGSVEEKAEYKKTMLGYIIGAIFLFTATTIPNALYKIGRELSGESVQQNQEAPIQNPNEEHTPQ